MHDDYGFLVALALALAGCGHAGGNHALLLEIPNRGGSGTVI